MKTPLFWAVSAIFCTVLIGCGGDPHKEKRTPTHPTTITIKHNGTAVEGATVTLVPNDQKGGQASYGTTDAEGVAKMKTFEPGDGAVAGEYTVTVIKTEAPAQSTMVDENDPNYDPDAGNEQAPPKHLLPEKYSKPKESGLSMTIKDGDNAETFDLK